MQTASAKLKASCVSEKQQHVQCPGPVTAAEVCPALSLAHDRSKAASEN